MSTTRVEAFNEWLKTAPPGQVFTYYTGFLALDRGEIVDIGDGVQLVIPKGDIDTLGRMAIDAFYSGQVHLFQRKIHDHEYQYIAMKRHSAGAIW